MPRRSPAPFAAPLVLWADLARRSTEMLVASAQVIGHRTGRMASAGATLSPRDRREFTLMGQEKVAAAGESAWAMGRHLSTLNAQLALRAWHDMARAGTAWLAVAGSRTWPQAMQRQAAWMQTMTQSLASASQLSGTAARLAGHGLAPIHSRATANARRLSRLR
jgi:hypothetical protein